jgi:hypothetical protein
MFNNDSLLKLNITLILWGNIWLTYPRLRTGLFQILKNVAYWRSSIWWRWIWTILFKYFDLANWNNDFWLFSIDHRVVSIIKYIQITNWRSLLLIAIYAFLTHYCLIIWLFNISLSKVHYTVLRWCLRLTCRTLFFVSLSYKIDIF